MNSNLAKMRVSGVTHELGHLEQSHTYSTNSNIIVVQVCYSL
jgi:hypothetical protein